MCVGLVLYFTISYAYCATSVVHESDISLLKDKFIKMEKIVTSHENRIAHLEGTILRQNTEINYLKVAMSRFSPKMRTLEQGLNFLKNILRRNKSQNPRTTDVFVKKPNIKQDYVPNRLYRRENGKDKRLLEGTSTVNTAIGFYAYLSQNEINPGLHHIIIFDVQRTNVGNGYNSFSGMFTVPQSGLYAFAVSIIMNHGYASFEIVKNNEVQGTLFIDAQHSNEYRSSSITLLLTLVQGDVVFVRTSSTYTPHGSISSWRNGRSSFAGWLIQ